MTDTPDKTETPEQPEEQETILADLPPKVPKKRANTPKKKPQPPPLSAKALPELDRDEPFDPRTLDLSPDVDPLSELEAPDELLLYYLSLARAHGIVYALDLKWMLDKLYRDHDYLQRYQRRKDKKAYDVLLLRDLKALAWLIAAAMRYVPEEVKREKIPPPRLHPDRSQPHQRKQQREARDTKTHAPGHAVVTRAEQLHQARTLLQQLSHGGNLEPPQPPRS